MRAREMMITAQAKLQRCYFSHKKNIQPKCGQKDKKRRNEDVKFKNILQKHLKTTPRLRSRVHFSFRDNLSQINKSFLRRFLVAESSASAAGICWLFCRAAELIKSAFGWHIDSSDSCRRRWRMLVFEWEAKETRIISKSLAHTAKNGRIEWDSS